MKKLFVSLAFLCLTYMTQATNPFFKNYTTPHETAPFNKIKIKDYEPAFDEGIRQQEEEINAIVNQRSIANFENTIEALEQSGRLLNKVAYPFFAVLEAEGNDEMMEISERLSAKLSEHSNNINLNPKLFERIKFVYDNKEKLNLEPDQKKLLIDTYQNMVRSGANLTGEQKEKYRALSNELSQLTLKFGQNVLKATNQFEMILTTQEELAGLPQSALEAAAISAKSKGKSGYRFDLSYPSYVPFMKYADRRDLREKMYRAYNSKCMTGEYRNDSIAPRIAEIRLEIARMMGYDNYGAFSLARKMAKNNDAVYKLLNQLLDAYKPVAQKEVQEVQKIANQLGPDKSPIMPWDWSYYADKLKDSKYALNDELLKPYFELERVKKGVFGLATDLYGITFKKNKKIQVYHPEVEAFEVYDENNNYLGVLYTDFHPRTGKRGGAWMTEMKEQYVLDGIDHRPHISIVMNFTRPTADKPALLTYDEVETFLHEFGHALHGLLTKTRYVSQSGTSVVRDFVELPSQIMENWLNEKDFLDRFAVHYQTGEKIPAEIIQKIRDAANFNAGYMCVRQLSFGLLDMAWHTIEAPVTDINTFEKQALASTQLFPSVDGTSSSSQFSHIFAGGYAAGYYSYKWAEVLDADAFSLFLEKGIFDKATAKSFLTNILEKGGSEDAMELFKRFRGHEPSIEALMRRDGIKK